MSCFAIGDDLLIPSFLYPLLLMFVEGDTLQPLLMARQLQLGLLERR
jgi:hypothetical protein